MANRGQKRTEAVDGLPADKRACSSLEFRPSSSNSSAQTPMSSAHEAQDADMDTSSSTSGSTRSEGDGEKESAYGSCDSDNSIHDYYRHRSMSDQSKFKKVLSSLSEEVEESGQLALLTELCELLSFCTDSSLSSLMVDSFSPVLVRLARHESNPDIMLLAIRAITYLCDVNPRSSGFLVRHDAVPALCQRLMAIEYLDVAEQCLQALEKISREQPLACLQSGAIMAVLSYIDFFSTSVQGLIGLLVKLAAGSIVAFRTLFELNISNTVKDMLSTYDLSHGTLYVSMVDGHHSQDGEQKSDKELFLLSHPDTLQKFGVDLLPILIQVVNSGVNLLICYGCLSVINKLVRFSSSGALHSLLQTANFSSFLAGVFTRKDRHVIILALRIVDTIMLKLPHVYLNSFVKEGVLFAIYALLSPDKDLKHSPDNLQDLQNGTCKLQKDTVQNLAKHIWHTYFETESVNPEKGVTDILQKLRTLSSALTALVNKSLEEATSSQQETEIYDLLHPIMSELNDKDSISTFEFVESGIIKALVNYLSNGRHIVGRENNNAVNNLCIMEKRFDVFGRLLSCANTAQEEFPLLILVRRLQSALSSVENFPVISSHTSRRRNSYATVPYGRCTSYPCLKVQFVREKGEVSLRDYADDVVNVDPFVSLEEIEGYLRPRVINGKTKILRSESKDSKEKDSSSSHSPSDSSTCPAKSIDVIQSTEMLVDFHKLQDKESNLLLSSPADTSSSSQRIMESADVADVQTDPLEQKDHDPLQEDGGTNLDHPGCSDCEDTSPKLLFYLDGQPLNCKLTLYQSILNLQTETDHDNISSPSLWNRIYKLTYRRHVTTRARHPKHSHDEAQCSLSSKKASFFQYTPYISPMFASEVDLEKLGPTYDILSLLKSLEGINRLRFHLMSRERTCAFAEGRTDDLDKLNLAVSEVPQNEFVNKKLTEKLEQQMRDPMAVSVGAMPAWCTQLMAWCPFLFGFEARCKYFHLAALGRSPVQTHSMSHGNAGGSGGRQQSRRKILVHRNKILESAAQMKELHAHQKAQFEVEYDEEVGTGLGPTLEFYTLVCKEFQRSGLGMWRDDTVSLKCTAVSDTENSRFLVSPFGLFPRPWSPLLSASSGAVYSEVIKKFSLLGYIVAKALQDGRVLDLPLSKALYKLILGKELSLYDIQSFDPASGRALLEFQAVVERKEYLRSLCKEESPDVDVCLRNTKIEDLCLDFTLPGYPDYVLVPETDSTMVNLYNLEQYITLMVDATTKSGIARQVEAFKSGFDQVFPVRHLKVFTEEELERLLCGEHVLWNSEDLLDHIKFDHGYTISSPPIVNLLEIMQEFDLEQQRAFLQFVTGAPRLPTGGLASLNPKLTIVRKHCSKGIDADLPSVMTCANYLKLPPYSSKEVMKEKLLYAITEGQGSFHLS
ncbi:UNVERIFIED_CONTAM: E3 ubiquitin-protein ligase UPL4 [Sesamum calycinum]|uniref:HECT-type E3 ubiquitin transferase n=1 Tax=Sesamum calycinum TaxID=2727403 RepID=A0AAW2NUG9_9LAMI